MICFKGRDKSKADIPHKPIGIGFNAYLLYDSETGFLLEWKMHTKTEKPDTTNRLDSEWLAMYTEKNIYIDRFYSTTKTFKNLEYYHDLRACGTINQRQI